MSTRASWLFLCLGVASSVQLPQHAVPSVQVAALSQAITDEVYVEGRQRDYAYAGSLVQGGVGVRISLYVEPTLDANGSAWVIYKCMPFGEVRRRFYVGQDGLVRLSGNTKAPYPFHPTQTDTRTVFLDDDWVCRMKAQWTRAEAVVVMTPDATTLAAASARQQERLRHPRGPDRE
jgi:hypothetical protein